MLWGLLKLVLLCCFCPILGFSVSLTMMPGISSSCWAFLSFGFCWFFSSRARLFSSRAVFMVLAATGFTLIVSMVAAVAAVAVTGMTVVAADTLLVT